MEDSIFTKIIKGEIPCHKIYEDDRVLAFLDIAPANTGHTLVIPKKQVEFVWDLEENDYAHLMNMSKKIATHLREKTGRKYVGSAIVGTDVPHAHVHLVPFDTTDHYYNIGRDNNKPTSEELAEIAKQLRIDD